MDTENLRTNASLGKRTMDTAVWRNQLPPDTRKKMFSKLMNTIRQHRHIFGEEGLNEVKEKAIKFEEKMYTTASSQSDYLKRISSEMIAMEKRSFECSITTHDKSQVERYHPHHSHPLIRRHWKSKCNACGEDLGGLCFGCEGKGCRFWLHEWCLEKPIEISHPRHPQHLLTLWKDRCFRYIVCDECLCGPEEGFCYYCLRCGFMLHLQCAFTTMNELPSSAIKESFRHVGHKHDLILYNQVRDIYESPRFVRKRGETTEQNILMYCPWCTKAVLSGSTYAC